MDRPQFEIDAACVQDALAFLAPLMEHAVHAPAVGQSGVLYAVVMNPARHPGSASFEDAVLFEQACGKPRAAWDADYAAYARKKARVSWSTGMDSGAARTAGAWRELGHEAPLPGGMVVHGIVVAVSGALPEYDEVLAGVIALGARAQAKLKAGAS